MRDEHPEVGPGPVDSDFHDLPDDILLPSDDELDAISQPEDDLSYITQYIQALIKDLYKLSFRIRNSTTKSTRAAHHKEIDPSSGLEIFGDCFAVFDRIHVRELFRSLRNESPTATAEDDILIQRFAMSNTTRRRQFRYWQNHAQKLTSNVTPALVTVNAIALEPVREFAEQPSGIAKANSPLSQSNHAKSMFTTTEATFFDLKLDLTPLETQSIVSSVTTARDLEGEPAELPPPPARGVSGQDFVCSYCFVLCPSRHGQDRAWRLVSFDSMGALIADTE